jgi:hypothetical protein
VPRSYFEKFSLPNPDGNYFLRPDRILGAFIISSQTLVPFDELSESVGHFQAEHLNDKKVGRKMNRETVFKKVNTIRLARFYQSSRPMNTTSSDGSEDSNEESSEHPDNDHRQRSTNRSLQQRRHSQQQPPSPPPPRFSFMAPLSNDPETSSVSSNSNSGSPTRSSHHFVTSVPSQTSGRTDASGLHRPRHLSHS